MPLIVTFSSAKVNESWRVSPGTAANNNPIFATAAFVIALASLARMLFGDIPQFGLTVVHLALPSALTLT